MTTYKHNINEIKEIIFKQNALYNQARETTTKAKEILKPFLNKQVTKSNTELFKKVKESLKPLEIYKDCKNYKKGNKAKVQVYFKASEFDIYVLIKFMYLGDSDKNGVCKCEYFEDYVYIGKIEKNILTSFYEREYKLINEESEIKKFIELQNKINEVITLKEGLHFKVKNKLSESLKVKWV